MPAIAFCVSIKHAARVTDDFNVAGFPAMYIDGSMSYDQRKQILNAFREGIIKVLVSCDLVNEGTDLPLAAVAILLRPTQSLSLYLQQCGRVSRLNPATNKQSAIVLDHASNVMRHGLPDDDRKWSLAGKEPNKRKSSTKVIIRAFQCEKCNVMYNGNEVCPYCYNINAVRVERKVNKVDGSLEEITDNDKESLHKLKAREIAMATTLEQLQEVAKKYNYKPGWAHYLFNSRQKNKVA